MENQWYIFKGTYHIGPFTRSEVDEYCRKIPHQGKQFLFWKKGLPDWIDFKKLLEEKNQNKQHSVPVIEEVSSFDQERAKVYHQLLQEMAVPTEENKQVKDKKSIVKLVFYGLCIFSVGIYTYMLMRKMFFSSDLTNVNDVEVQRESTPQPHQLEWKFIPEAKVFELSGFPAIYSEWNIRIQATLKEQKQMKNGDIVFQGKLVWKEGQHQAYLDQLKMIKGAGPVAGFYHIEWELGDWKPKSSRDQWILSFSRHLQEACTKLLGTRSFCLMFDLRQRQLERLQAQGQKLSFEDSYFPVGAMTLESWKKEQESLSSEIIQESSVVDDEGIQKRDLLLSLALKLNEIFEKSVHRGHESFYRQYQEEVGKPLQSLYLSERNDHNQPHKIYLDFTEIGKEILTYLQSPPPTRLRKQAVEKAIHQRLAHLRTDIQEWRPLETAQLSKKAEYSPSSQK